MTDGRPEVATMPPAGTADTINKAYSRAAKRVAEELRGQMPTHDLLLMSNNGFLLAHDELAEVIRRLGDRQRDLEELMSIAKSLEVLARKVKHLEKRLIPDAEEGADVR